MTEHTFYIFLIVMAVIALLIFPALLRVDAGYGKFYNKRWGPTLDNHLGWFLMEVPVFIAMLALWWFSERRADPVRLMFLVIFELHYFHRSFIFPLRLRGHSLMPWAIVLMGALFNTLNALMQGGWIFYISPAEMYPLSWLTSLQFITGCVVFAAGMFINLQSDSIIRNLRAPGDTAHYLPKGGMFRYVAGANYLGELLEWTGFAVLTWSWSGAVFALWTFANLAPRASRTRELYAREFPDEFDAAKVKRIIPFIY